MPRKGKRYKESTPQGNRRRRHESIATFWKDRINSAKKAKAEYDEIAEEVVGFFKAKHDGLFKDPKIQHNFLDFREALAVSVPKVAQAKNTLGPNLYPVNPKRVVTPDTDSMIMLALSRVLQEYLNYTAGEAKIQRQIRRNIDDAILRGRGFMEVYYDGVLEIVTSRFTSSKNVLIDPDVEYMEEAKWVAIREVMPLWELKRKILDGNKKDRWRIRDLKEHARNQTLDDSTFKGTEKYAPTNHNVEVWRIYSKMGCGLRGFGFGDGFESYQDDDDFVCVGVCEDSTVPVFERDWEVPLYLDKEWPIVPLDYVETIDQLWPVSIMGQVLALQKGMDLITSMQLSSAKQRGRFIMLGDSKIEKQYQTRIRSGGVAEYIPVDLEQGESLRTKFEVLNMGSISEELRREREFYEREIETTTGVTPVVTGIQTGTQERSASASQLRGQAAGVRLSDLKFRTEEQQGSVARAEAIYAKLELDVDEVAPYVRESKIGMFWVRVEVAGGAVLSLRPDEEDLEEGELENENRALTLLDITPLAANFFPDAQSAMGAAMEVWESLKAADDPRLIELRMGLGPAQQEEDPESGQMFEIPPRKLTAAPVGVEDVWRETASLTAQDMVRELSYSLATGSTPSIDPAYLQDLVETMVNQMGPAAMQSGNTEVFNQLMAWWQDIYEVPDDKRLGPILMAPQPVPGGPGGAQ